MASVNLTPLSSAMASSLPSLEQIQSSDYFQQMLSTDSALEALSISRSDLELKLQALTVRKGQPLSAEAAAEYDAITESIADLEELVETFEDLQEEARHLFKLRARSLRQREIGILDMPNEVLLAIFQNFRPPLDFSTMSPHEGNSGADVEAIKSVRLTCLRFRQNSSHLLIGHLTVSPNNLSLDRLEKISSHPQVSGGEWILSIDLRYYRSSIARDFHGFSAMCIRNLERSIESLQSSIWPKFSYNNIESLEGSNESSTQIREQEEGEEGQEEKSSLLPRGMSEADAKYGIMKLHVILSIWKRLSNGDYIEEPNQPHPAMLDLRKGHKRYRELYQQQQRLIQDGSFARAVAATAAASRSKVWLSMSDVRTGSSSDRHMAELKELSKSNFLSFTDPHHFDHALSYIAPPQPWWVSMGATLEELPQSLLCEIPLAMHTAQAKLAGLEVCVHDAAFKLDLSMSREQLLCFREATKDLEAFKFAVIPAFDDIRLKGIDSRNLLAYVGAAMGPSRPIVPHLYLDVATEETEPLGIGLTIKPLLHVPNWHGLKAAVLGNFDVRLEDLKKLTDMLAPGTKLCLRHIYLTSGTWAEALDCLRSKVSRASWLSVPSGAECDSMGYEEYEEMFDPQESKDGGVEGSKATQYITSVEGVENPLRGYIWNDSASESDAEP